MTAPRFGVVVFPGSNCDHDAYHALKHVLHQDVQFLWHKDSSLQGVDVVILPGGYLVYETVSITGTDSSNHKHSIRRNHRRSITMAKTGTAWEIENLQWLVIPSVYDSLTNRYAGIGQPGLAYVCHITLDRVSVIETGTNRLVGTIPCGAGTAAIGLARANHQGFVANFSANSVTVFNTMTNEPTAQIPVGQYPSFVTVDVHETYVWVAHQSRDGLWVIDRASGNVLWRIPDQTGNPYWNERARRIYQPQIFKPRIDVIPPYPYAPIERIEVGGRPCGLAFTSDEDFAYVANWELNELEKIDTRTNTVVKRIRPVPSPRSIGIDAEDKYAYVAGDGSGKLTIVDIRKDCVIGSFDIGQSATDVSLSTAHHCVYVPSQGDETVAVFDTETRMVRMTIAVADNPISILVDNGKLFGGLYRQEQSMMDDQR